MAAVSFLAAPTLWALHLMVCYFLVALDCTSPWNGAEAAIGIATVLFAGAAAGSGLLAWRAWRRTHDTMMPGELMEPARVGGFLAFSGIILAPPFTLMIVLAGMSPLFAPICG